MPALTDSVALVTGASRGAGAAIAQALAREGAAVCVNYLKSHNKALEVVASIEAWQTDTTRRLTSLTRLCRRSGRPCSRWRLATHPTAKPFSTAGRIW